MVASSRGRKKSTAVDRQLRIERLYLQLNDYKIVFYMSINDVNALTDEIAEIFYQPQIERTLQRTDCEQREELERQYQQLKIRKRELISLRDGIEAEIQHWAWSQQAPIYPQMNFRMK